ncbi:hypothetical protein PQU63_08485 [Xanthomonas protegens]|uniref:Uncharacterized protein n=1 Tax=Xanthomonas protegens TaxID=3380705 RepID=A0ABU9LC96_9XANT
MTACPFRTPKPRSGYTQGIPLTADIALAKPNYSFEKRQRELAKKKQQEEKEARKREARAAAAKPASDDDAATHEADTASDA